MTATPDVQLKPGGQPRLAAGRWRVDPALSHASFAARVAGRPARDAAVTSSAASTAAASSATESAAAWPAAATIRPAVVSAVTASWAAASSTSHQAGERGVVAVAGPGQLGLLGAVCRRLRELP